MATILELRLFGGLDLRAGDGHALTSVLRQPKRAALLAYLAVGRRARMHRRDTLVALFWPELDHTRARNALNTAISYLRQTLGADFVISRGDEEVGLAVARLWVDTKAFEDAIDGGELEAALELYVGDLLPGFHSVSSAEFDEWLESERARLRLRAADAALTLADRCAATRTADSAAVGVFYARRAVALARDDERGRRRLIELLAAVGDRAGALRAYEELAGWLAMEFRARPAAETQSLAERVRRGESATAAS
jgi:DNA-binding SARP family transcriptional activator